MTILMTNTSRFYVVSYDIEKDRARTRIARLLLGFGERVQKSVYEVRVPDNKFARLEAVANKLMGPDDSIRWYPLCETCRNRVVIWGNGELTQVPDVWVV